MDLLQHALKRLLHVLIGEAYHPVTQLLQSGSPYPVFTGARYVNRSVKFDDQICGGAVKIDDKTIQWMLPAELKFVQSAAAQVLPKRGFSRRSVMPHAAGFRFQPLPKPATSPPLFPLHSIVQKPLPVHGRGAT